MKTLTLLTLGAVCLLPQAGHALPLTDDLAAVSYTHLRAHET